jgi:mono/diheme cytochrome c family protein
MAVPLFAVGIDRRTDLEPDAARAASRQGAAGQQLFVQTCGGCHTLSAASSSGTAGPDLDKLRPSRAAVLAAIEVGGRATGAMPARLLSGAEAERVAAFVAKSVARGSP